MGANTLRDEVRALTARVAALEALTAKDRQAAVDAKRRELRAKVAMVRTFNTALKLVEE